MPPESIELVVLRLIAYHDPIDSRSLRKCTRERLGEQIDRDIIKDAAENLQELGLVERPGMGHVIYHITNKGWRHLGGETTRYGREIDPGTVAVCPVCEADDIVESDWAGDN